MSASKKNNKTEVAMTERQRQEAKEAKSVKRMTFIFLTAIILCVAIFVVSVAAAPAQSLVRKSTKAVTVGEHNLTAVELNYFYIDAINAYYNNVYSTYYSYYGDYWYLALGADTSKPLNEQTVDSTTGQTWADYFLEVAVENIKSTYALYDEAMKQGFTLPEDEQASLSNTISNMDSNIKTYASLYASMGYSYPYSSAADYLKSMYGNGASTKSYQSYYEICYIADAYYTAYSDSLEYDEEALRAYEQDIATNYNAYTYSYYLLKASDYYEGGTEGEDGKTTYTDEEKQAGIDTAKLLADQIAAGTCESLDDFDELINLILNTYEAGKTPATSADEAEGSEDATEGEDKEEEEDEDKVTSTKKEDQLGSGLSTLFAEWLTEEGRTEGNMTVVEYSSGSDDEKVINGYYVVCFGSVSDNFVDLVDVRHILVKFQHYKADGTVDSSNTSTTYTDDEKETAMEKAGKLLADFLAGDVTEEAFAELATKNSADTGSASNGGLYENIYPGQMVEEFENWCFDETRKEGDTGIVESTYGYHIMYFSGMSGITYRDYLITNDIRSDDLTAWHDALVEALSFTLLTDKHVDKDITMSEATGS